MVVLSTAAQSQLKQALVLLRSGRPDDAVRIAAEVARRNRDSVDAWHLVALGRKAHGDVSGSVTAFEIARKLAPNDATILGNYANLLEAAGRWVQAIALYRQAVELSPTSLELWLHLGIALSRSGECGEALAALDQAIQLGPSNSSVWQAIGVVKRESGDLLGAEFALRRAVGLDSRNGSAWVNLGVVRRLLGDPEDSMSCYGQARKADFSGPELYDAEASANLDLGNTVSAIATVRHLTRMFPSYVPGHSMLARILWEHQFSADSNEDPCRGFRAAVESQPGNRALHSEYVRFLLEADRNDEALEVIRALRYTDDSPVLVATEAHALEKLGNMPEAANLFAKAYGGIRLNVGLLNLYVRFLLKSGDPEAAAKIANEVLEIDRYNQCALAYLSVAWRLLGDARGEWLCGYDTLISESKLPVPDGYANEVEFLSTVEIELTKIHAADREPLDQSLRGGTQTPGVLFGRRSPAINALRDAIAAAVSQYVDALPDETSHPFLQRKTRRFQFAGSWSVRLRSSGRHVNHYHQYGWISSAYYVSLPPSVADAQAEHSRGCIQFGMPPEELGLNLSPRRIIRPQVGRLLLFPSYLWHGTLPFEDLHPRVTVAFDVTPVT